MIIACDFDGTVVENAWPEIGPALPGAVETLQALVAAGHELIIWTCRKKRHEVDARYWLAQHGIAYARFNENSPDMIDAMSGDTRKVFAHVYIDDRNLGGFPGWAKVAELLGINGATG
jgi:ribonucleotide monophosphatase NagD (HAD superfamily)